MSKNKKFKVGFFQFQPKFGKTKKNTQKILNKLDKIQADLIVLPELPFTGYLFKNKKELLKLAENPAKSDTIEQIVKLCKQKKFYIVTGFAEKHRKKCYNSALLLGPKGIIHTYRKLHLFDKEKNYFDPGNKQLAVQTIKGIKIGMMVCYDWAFPEVTRTLTLKGAEVICHPSNLVLNYCQETMTTRSLENGIFVITANRFGQDSRKFSTLSFSGKSQITAPGGTIIYRAPAKKEVLYTVQLDISKSRDKKLTPNNHLLKDRRPKFYRK